MRFALLIASLLLQVGCCADRPLNPSFPLTMAQAECELEAMNTAPKPLVRPVIVVSGIFDPGIGSQALADELRSMCTGDAPIIAIHFSGAKTFDACAARVIEAIEHAIPSADLDQTIEVDVVASSMGGVVARVAATDDSAAGRKRLNIGRLFTISTPHRGAKLAHSSSFDKRISAMCHDSDLITSLNAEPCGYELIAYTRLDDGIVGEENTAPPGQNPYWVANMPFRSAHLEANNDPRILADIARRLRGEQPYTRESPAELPPRKGAWRSTLLAEK